jgi:hypothetical protein
MREKRPGRWEIRVVVSNRPTVQRSFVVRGMLPLLMRAVDSM